MPDPVDQLGQQLLRQESGCAATEMHLFNNSTAVEERAALGDFVKQASDIGIGVLQMTRDDLVAAAVETGTEAEGYVHVQGQRMSFERAVAGGCGAFIVVDADSLVKLQRRRIRGVARTFAIVAYTHLRAHETRHDLVCRLLLEK